MSKKNAALFTCEITMKTRLCRYFRHDDSGTVDYVIDKILLDLKENITTFEPLLDTLNDKAFDNLIKRSRRIIKRLISRLKLIEHKSEKIITAINKAEELLAIAL